jgi:hypothetical protein
MERIDGIDGMDDMDGMEDTAKKPRLIFPLSFFLYNAPETLIKGNCTEKESDLPSRKFCGNVLVYTYDHSRFKTIDEFCEADNFNEDQFEALYNDWGFDSEDLFTVHYGEPTPLIEKHMQEYEKTFGKKSAIVVVNTDLFRALCEGTFSYFKFAVIAAVLSRFGNTKKTGNFQLWHVITYDEIRGRMLGYTQWKHEIAQEAVSKVKITDLRIKNVLEEFEDKLFYRLYDGRKWWYTSRRNYDSREEFRVHFGKVREKKSHDKRNTAREDIDRIAQVVKDEAIKRGDVIAQNIAKPLPKDIGDNLARVLAEIENLFAVRLHSKAALEQYQQIGQTTFHCGKMALYAIKWLSGEQIKRIQEMLDNVVNTEETFHPISPSA